MLPDGESQAVNSSVAVVSIHSIFRDFNNLVTNFLAFGGGNGDVHSTVIDRNHSRVLLGIVSSFMAFHA